jgi:response regulator RpfG family c-di-GMP phosphodiesterase
LNLPDNQYINIGYAAALMDIGKLKVTEENYDDYPMLGAEMLSKVDLLRSLVPMIKHQCEKNNGSGYPDGLTGESIPLGARILSIAQGYVQSRFDNPELKEDELLNRFMSEYESSYDPGLKLVFLSVVAVRFGGKLPEV